ncbi:MAG: hypothetical protein L6Q98_00985 [Anaerolineae bacterium]|nr:hypothetical protein [Anaerolineae bacterium]NUQ03928.1 hypothetical protein [Anaerolineae bacterium]
MIQVPAKALPAAAQTELQRYQQEVDAEPDYAARVGLAKDRFSGRNRKDNPVFQEIRGALTEMCSGANRCMYCEDSCADEVEHIKPKNFYPEAVFVWENYLYACGICNGGKNDSYAVFDDATAQILPVSRKHGDPVVPPPAGRDVFLNPRQEAPTRFLILDLRGTFAFLPYPDLHASDQQRAKYTIDVLNLNRDVLLRARRNAYGNYRNLLELYALKEEQGKPDDELEALKETRRLSPHPSVWFEMTRLWDKIPELTALFQRVPEALTWQLER